MSLGLLRSLDRVEDFPLINPLFKPNIDTSCWEDEDATALAKLESAFCIVLANTRLAIRENGEDKAPLLVRPDGSAMIESR